MSNINTLYDSIETAPASPREPIDPNKIRVSLWNPTLDLILKRIKNQEIDLATDIQRFLWDNATQSRLIESLLIKIPLPAFFVDGTHEDMILVVDGIQRLNTLKRYILDDAFALEGLEYLQELEGKRFKDLKRPLQRRLEESTITVHRIEAGTSDAAKLNIFQRINRSALPLSAQEIRHAISPGPMRARLTELARSPEFVELMRHEQKPKRMEDEELVLLFLAGPRLPERDFDAKLLDCLRGLNADEERREAMSARFMRALRASQGIFREQAFRRTKGERVHRGIFLSVLHALDSCSDEEIASLVDKASRVRSAVSDALAKNESLSRSLRDLVSPERDRIIQSLIKDSIA